MLQLKNISKLLNNETLDKEYLFKDLNLNINFGDRLLISGENGVGKTTLLRIIGCVEKNFEGQYFINNNELRFIDNRNLSTIRNEIFGFVFQDYKLIEDETVKYNISIPLIYSKKFTKKEKLYRLDIVAKDLEIKGILNKKVSILSGGEKQKVAICRAIVNEPKVLILDEPTASLHPKLKTKFYKYLFDNIEETTTVIMVSHDLGYFDGSKFDRYELTDGKLVKEFTG